MNPKSHFRIRALAVAGAFLLAGGYVPAAAAAVQDATPSEAQRRRLAIFDYVWTEIRDKYYDASLNGVDWQAVRERYRPGVDAAASDEDLHRLLRSMVGELRDAHTRVFDAREARDRRRNQATSAGAILFEVEGRPVVFAVVPGSPAAEAGLRPGMRVAAVNGVPVETALAAARADVGSSSSERATLLLAYSRLVAGPPESMLRLRLADVDGALRDVELPRRTLDSSAGFEARRLASGVLYVRIQRYRRPVARLLRQALEQHRDAFGLILDLRANPGGDGIEGVRSIGPLFSAPTLVARLATRTGRAPSALLGLVRLPLEMSAGSARGQLFAGPVVVLVNEGTASTSEVVAASLQERGRARVVGARSCGCALGILRYRRLANGGALAISEIGLVSGLGRRIEGEGVRPDIPVELRLADLEQGRDPALEAALAAMRR